MSDVDHDRLYDIAQSQAGHFTAGQAIDAGMDRSTLRYHARPGGWYERIGRGVYRLRHFPASPHEHVVAAWLPLRQAGAVISHASALELYELSDVIADAVHVSIARSKRGQRPRTGVQIHTWHAHSSRTRSGTWPGSGPQALNARWSTASRMALRRSRSNWPSAKRSAEASPRHDA